MRNRKGSFYIVASGIALLVGGILLWALLDTIVRGNADITGLVAIGNTSLGISNASGTRMALFTEVWMWTPLAILMAFAIYVLTHSQKKGEYYA